ncbi:MAG: LysR family transcriptional regulator [Parafilimonas terrae]|nr:LysR family transcriptional regulator [Parafilimonas terrae]
MHQVLYFRALSEELNFTQAAARCGVSQPSLTRAIRLLEEEFGGRLFHRERNNTQLSELGRIIKPHLYQIIEQAEVASQRARGLKDLQKSRLRLGVMCTIAPNDLTEFLGHVRARNPEIFLDVLDSDAERLDRALRGDDLEVAIMCAPANMREKHLHYIPLFRERFMVVTSPEHRFASLKEVRVADLAAEAYLKRTNCEIRDLAGQALAEHGFESRVVFQSDRDDWILAMAATGAGFSFMPERAVNHPRVISRPLVDPEFWREVSLVTVRGRPHSAAVGALVHAVMRSASAGGRTLAAQNRAVGQSA